MNLGIEQTKICDGNFDCFNKADESSCSNRWVCMVRWPVIPVVARDTS